MLNAEEELRKQRANLKRDLELIKSGWQPDENTLKKSPVLKDWYLNTSTFDERKVLTLSGIVKGHPKLRNGASINTSQLFSLNAKTGWSRTSSRFYRLGPSVYDKKSSAQSSLQVVDDVKAYTMVCQSLPRPTEDQISEFAEFVSKAHSWYKHLPLAPPGSAFHFYLDPAAGLQRIIRPDGSTTISVREKTGFHYSWIATDRYRHNYGYLAFAQARGICLIAESRDGHRIPADDKPIYYHPDRVALGPIPRPLLLLGTCYVSGLVHPETNPLFLRLFDSRFANYDDVALNEFWVSERDRQKKLIFEACRRVCSFIWDRHF